MKRVLAIVLAVVLLIGIAVGATIAWLTDKTQTTTNVFTVSDVDIALAETTGAEYKMIPGHYVIKDPKATVLADSEKCWLFVKLEKSSNFDQFMTYTIADGWTPLAGQTGVYYRMVEDTTADQEFAVLKDNKVNILDSVTKQMMDGLTTETYPKLNVTAYAIQYMKNNAENFTEAEAWAAINGT